MCNRCTGGLCQGNLEIDYSFSIQNGQTGGGKDGHLSADEEGMLAISAIFFCLQFLLVIAVFLIQIALTRIDKYHITVKMLKWSVIITFISYIFILIYYVYYNNDGHKWKLLHTFSAMFQQLSETILVLLLILLAKGWTIAVRKISRQGRMKIAIYFTIYLWVSLAAVLWKDYGLDELDSKFVSKNPPGIVLIVVKCGVLLWFCYAMFTTCKNVHRKVHFYQKFFIASVIWIVACILITGLVDVFQETKRITIYNSLMYVITYLLQLVFCILYHPNLKFNSSFPFHMKTSDWSDKKDQEKRLVNPNPSDPEQMSDWFSAQTTYIRDLSLQLTKIFDSTFKEIYPATVQYLQGGRKRFNAEEDDDEINDTHQQQPHSNRSFEERGSINEEREDEDERLARLNTS